VEDDPNEFMTGLVDHMNGLVERLYWANGDEDGVIIHDKHDVPVLSLTYTNQTLKFALFEVDEVLESGINRDAGLMLLNILGYIRERDLDCEPEAFRVRKTVIPPSSSNKQIDADDWSL
jgi:hypothetical protein